jgi:Tfp pilus assembly protein PilO
MKKLTSILILLSVIVVVIFGLYIFLLWTVHDNSNKDNILNQEISAESTKRVQIVSTKKLIADTASIRGQLSGFLIETNEIPEFLESVEALGTVTKTKVTVNSVSRIPINTTLSSSTEYLLLSISSVGGFRGVYQFLRLIESLPYGVYIDSVQLSSSGISEDKKQKTISLPEWTAGISLRATSKISNQ